MKIQKITFTLLSLMAVPGSVYSEADRYYSYTDHEDNSIRGIMSPGEKAFAQATVLVCRLFNSIEQGSTETRSFLMRDAVAKRVGNGEGLTTAFMDEAKAFLTREMRTSIINVIKKKKLVDVNVDGCVRALMQMVVDGTKERYGVENVFEQDPYTLPAFVFTYYTHRYVEAVLLEKGLPMATRDTALITAWAKSVYIGLGYIQQFCENGRTALELFGVQE